MDITSEGMPVASENAAKKVIYRQGSYFRAKRLLDIVISLLALIALSPIFLLLAIIIKLDSRGPVLFRQTRVGARWVKKGESYQWEREDFVCFKFRSMVNHAREEVHKNYVTALITNDEKTMQELQGDENTLHKLVHDDRITRVGKFIRKSSLDETPQFFNVLRGDMSLVGPRPAIPYEVDLYSPRQLRRLQAKPGITGLQQITARCTLDFDNQVNLDIKYIENQSLGMDLKILFLTPFAIFKQKGV
ncbi:MAG: sugar transferase [Anaerolineaceae bacterium]|jgi:lipopolysaccharide/colanic/teichoic acid biosynthesis glycosyltransferase